MLRRNLFLVSACMLAFAAFFVYVHLPRDAAASAPVSPRFTLVIDAGHGGEDGGAVSVSGKKESTLNLEIAKKAEKLAALVGIRPLMIRDTDISVHGLPDGTISQKKVADLKNRVKTVEKTAGAILLSIHQNHFAEEKYYGAQVFYASTPQSKAYAERIQKDLKTVLDHRNHRACKQARNVYLMERISCTAVLVECGFLSNFAEDRLLQQDGYQKKLAAAMLRTIALYGNRGMDHEI